MRSSFVELLKSFYFLEINGWEIEIIFLFRPRTFIAFINIIVFCLYVCVCVFPTLYIMFHRCLTQLHCLKQQFSCWEKKVCYNQPKKIFNSVIKLNFSVYIVDACVCVCVFIAGINLVSV